LHADDILRGSPISLLFQSLSAESGWAKNWTRFTSTARDLASTLVVDGRPEAQPLAGDPHHHLSRCHRSVGRGRRRRSRRAITGPNFSTQPDHFIGDVEPGPGRSAEQVGTKQGELIWHAQQTDIPPLTL